MKSRTPRFKSVLKAIGIPTTMHKHIVQAIKPFDFVFWNCYESTNSNRTTGSFGGIRNQSTTNSDVRIRLEFSLDSAGITETLSMYDKPENMRRVHTVFYDLDGVKLSEESFE